MKIVLLSGGSGKRLWPLYGEARSRQFLKVLKDDKGDKESIIMRVWRQLRGFVPADDIYVTAIKAQEDSINRQLHIADKRHITEPERRGTYPAVLLSAAYILQTEGAGDEEVITFIPVDPYVEEDYFALVTSLGVELDKSGVDVGLIGVKPTYPSTKYGYITGIIDENCTGKVTGYVEKPSESEAAGLIASGARWNGGVFALKVSYLKELIADAVSAKDSGSNIAAASGSAAEQTDIDYSGLDFGNVYDRLTECYGSLPHTSFDRQVLERHPAMIYLPYDGQWKDLGTWNTLTSRMEEPDGGYVVRGEDCEDTHIVNELGIPVVALGLRDMVVVASADGILVSDKHASSFMEPYVEKLGERPMYEKRQWGEYRVLDACRCTNNKEGSLTKRLYLEKGKSLSYQRHFLRDEIWTIIDGTGFFVLDGEIREVKRGEVLYIRKGQWHSIASLTGVEFVEVQLGTELVEEDIERRDYDWTPMGIGDE